MRFLQTIEVKYHGLTEFKPTRLSATASGSRTRRYYTLHGDAFNDLHTDEERYQHAAEMLRDELEWTGNLVGGWIRGGAVFVFEGQQ